MGQVILEKQEKIQRKFKSSGHGAPKLQIPVRCRGRTRPDFWNSRISGSVWGQDDCKTILTSTQQASSKHCELNASKQENLCRVAQEPNRKWKPEPLEPLCPKPKADRNRRNRSWNRNRSSTWNRPFLLNCTETHKNPFCSRGTAGTENRNRLNRSIPKP